MKLPTRLLLLCTLATLLIACEPNQGSDQKPSTPATLAEPANTDTPLAAGDTDGPMPDTGQYAVDLSSGNVSIRANQVNELVLFKGVADKAGFQLLTENFDWKTVTVDIHSDTLHAAVVELVSAYPYEIVHAPDERGQREVLSEVVIGTPAPALTQQDGDKEAAPNPGKEALLYIKEYAPEEQQLAYLEKLQDPTAEIRAAAAKEIIPVGDALNRLTDMIVNDPSPEVRIATTWSLEVSDDAEAPQAIEALVKCLDDKDYIVVTECVESLAFIGDETTVVYLQPLMTHPDEDVRTAALEAIQYLQ